jgi:hypothetical protein
VDETIFCSSISIPGSEEGAEPVASTLYLEIEILYVLYDTTLTYSKDFLMECNQHLNTYPLKYLWTLHRQFLNLVEQP